MYLHNKLQVHVVGLGGGPDFVAYSTASSYEINTLEIIRTRLSQHRTPIGDRQHTMVNAKSCLGELLVEKDLRCCCSNNKQFGLGGSCTGMAHLGRTVAEPRQGAG